MAPELNYEKVHTRSNARGFTAAVVIYGILMPYLTLPISSTGFPSGLPTGGHVFLVVVNVVAWGPVCLFAWLLKRLSSKIAVATLGLMPLSLAYLALDFSSDPQAPVALLILPFLAITLLMPGWLLADFIESRHRVAPAEYKPHATRDI